MHRFAEIDLLRGAAVLGMILFHFLFDLNFFGIYPTDLDSGAWFAFARLTAFAFVFLAGLSCVLFSHRKGEGSAPRLRLRGLLIFLFGLAVTLVTYLAYPSYAILFGALHLIGLSIFLSPYFIHRPTFSLVAGLVVLCVGILFSLAPFSIYSPHLTGLFPFPFSTFDYFPIFPWLGVFLLGVWAGNRWYDQGTPRPPLGWKTIHGVWKPLQWIGQHSLLIYLIHQPLLLAAIYFFPH